MARPVPQEAIELIKEFEGCELTGYLDIVGVPTIGYGHTGPEVKAGATITELQADLYLAGDAQTAARKLAGVVKSDVLAELSDGQYGALVSFVFNLGANKSWTIWKVLNARQFEQVPVQMMRFVYAGGKKVKGLVRRRTAEVALWHSDAEDVRLTARVQPTPPVSIEDKPLKKSRTMWLGGGITLAGMTEPLVKWVNELTDGARQVQALAGPQAQNSEIIANVSSAAAVVIVGGGALVMFVRWQDQRRKQK